MSYSISNWSGRLGNNIQQVANCIMAAEKNNTDFTQVLDHDIISKFYVNFGSNIKYETGRFYTWEALVNCENGCYEGGNETGVGVEHIYKNMRRVCKRIAPNLNLPKKDPIGEDTIVMHLRSGDNYHRVFDPPTNYVPNPLIFYLNLINLHKFMNYRIISIWFRDQNTFIK